ncbi:MAG: DUF2442 domain-containing protein [Bacteroidaceae bacterium]|nr:DUF2442 domain-containing protein [Bacteroidaceae bacterium]
MKIKEILFDADYIYGRDDEGREYRQSLLWYPRLRQANDEERGKYTFSISGIHWRYLDEDVSFGFLRPTTSRLTANGICWK